MRRFTIMLAAALLLLVSCGGGSDATTTSGAAAPDQTTAPDVGDGGDGNSGSNNGGGQGNADFCDQNSDFDPFAGTEGLTDPDALRTAMNRALDQIDEVVDSAPSEIREDVGILASGLRAFVDFLDENDYDYGAVIQAVESGDLDLPFDDAEFEAAADHVAEYCGVDLPDGDGSDGDGGGIGAPSVDLPDEFPQDLVPPDSTVEGVFNVSGVITASFSSSASFDDLVDYYTDLLGDPLAATQGQVTWSSFGDGGVTSVTIAGDDGAVQNVVVAVSDQG